MMSAMGRSRLFRVSALIVGLAAAWAVGGAPVLAGF